MLKVTELANGRAWTRIHVGFTLKSMRAPNLSLISANGSFASQAEIPNSATLVPSACSHPFGVQGLPTPTPQ